MTTTYLVTYGDGATGTRQVEAHDEAEALAVARQYLGVRDWRIVGTVEPPKPWTPPIYHPDLVDARDPLESED